MISYAVGNTLEFGGYSWLILQNYGDHVLVISADVLEERHAYHSEFEFDDDDVEAGEIEGDVTWERCTLRKWLNEKFFSTFTQMEQEKILLANLKNFGNPVYGTDGGNDTYDRIFMLCIDDVERYLTEEQRSVSDWWWLRSPGDGEMAAVVTSSGTILTDGLEQQEECGVRPVFFLKIT